MKTTHALYFASAVLVAAVLLVGDEEDKGPLSAASSDGVHIPTQAAKTHEASARTERLSGFSSTEGDLAADDDVEEFDHSRDSVSEVQNSFSVGQRDASETGEQPALTVAGAPVPAPETQYIEH